MSSTLDTRDLDRLLSSLPDLSRGALVRDIVNTIAITAVQAGA